MARIQDIGMAALLCDSSGCILTMNQQASAVLDPGAVPGSQLENLAAHEAAAAELRSTWGSHCNQGVGWSYEGKLKGRMRALVDLHLVVIPVSSVSSTQQVWLVVMQDLTATLFHARELEIYALELGQLYQKNRQDLRRLEEAERSREQFFSLVSHELKTPLTSLKAALEMLCTPEVLPLSSKDAWRLADTMKRSGVRLERLMNDLLDIAIARSGGMDLSFAAVDVCDVINAVVDEMTPVANERGVVLAGNTKSKHGLVVKGDDLRLQQVFLNLVSNAIKATPPQGTVRMKCTRSANTVQVVVTNPGELSETIKGSLFEPFRKSAAGGYKAGAGLGLTVVQALVQAHKGGVEATSRRKQVAFTVTLPLWGKGGAS